MSGKGVTGGGFEVSAGSGEGDSGWVSNQSSIISAGLLEAEIEEHTQLTGGVLGSLSNNLSLNTGSLGYEDIYDYDEYTEIGATLGRHDGATPINEPDSDGSTTITNVNKGSEKEQETRATEIMEVGRERLRKSVSNAPSS
ncbi:MAG: hypothetical protein LBM71_03160 [Elusimicrobiota bacterium]|jgi:filamentous hemagglutinin|nr:hypothetical protein [Elusimicrobiota bacterium]